MNIGALRGPELPGHAQTVTDSDCRIALPLNISLGFIRCSGPAVERQRFCEAALRTGTLAASKHLIGSSEAHCRPVSPLTPSLPCEERGPKGGRFVGKRIVMKNVGA